MVRLPADLKERLREQAILEHRTLTGQVVHLLAKALPDEKAEAAPTAPAQ